MANRAPLDAHVRIDWFRVFDDLKREGLSMYAVEMRLSVPKSTMHGWKAGAEPKFSEGERLLWLWGEVTGKAREEAPMISRYSPYA